MAQLTPPGLFAVPRGSRSRISASAAVRCSLCPAELTGDKMVRQLEQSEHSRDAFRCASCGKAFACSEDLRRHSRSTGHFIPVTFRLTATDFTPAQAAAQPTTGDDSADLASSAGDWEIVQAGSLDSAVSEAHSEALEKPWIVPLRGPDSTASASSAVPSNTTNSLGALENAWHVL